VAEVFAGFVSGYALALLTTPLFSMWLLRLRATSPLLERLLPAGVGAVSVSVLLHTALTMFWTAMGLLLGLVLFAMRDADGALGSLNAPYTLFVAALFLAIGAPLVAVLVPWRRVTVAGILMAVVVFGWLTPYLARWSNFDS
jgi:hypothetical protein